MDRKLEKFKIDDLEYVKRSMAMAQKLSVDLQLNSDDAKIKKETSKNIDFIASHLKSIEQGYNFLITEIEQNAVEGLYFPTDMESIPVESYQIDQSGMQNLKNEISQPSNQQQALYPLCGYSTDILLAFYALAIKFYEEAFYEKSIDSLIFLTTLHPHIESFWSALGMAYEKNLNFARAIEMFEIAIKKEPTSFSPFLGLIRCSEELKDYSTALKLLEEQANNEAIKEDVETALLYIKSKK